jgi:hypothetical protein
MGEIALPLWTRCLVLAVDEYEELGLVNVLKETSVTGSCHGAAAEGLLRFVV